MKRFITSFVLFCLLILGVQAQTMQYVQGVPREVPALQKTLKALDEKLMMDKVQYFVGEGTNTSLLVVEWCDGKGVDKMVWGYHWNDADQPNGEAMLRAVAAADPRFYILVQEGTQFGSAIGGIGMDLNGSGNIALMAEGNRYEVDEKGVVLTGDYSFDDFTAADSTDHWRAGWYDGFWCYYVSDDVNNEPQSSGLGASSRMLTNGCVDHWKWTVFGSGELTEVSNYFYTPAPQKGVWLPEKMSLKIADNAIVPVLLQKDSAKVESFSWKITKVDNKSVIKKITSAVDQINGVPEFTGELGAAEVQVTATMDGERIKSNTCVVNVVAPEIPISGITFEQDTIVAGLKMPVTFGMSLVPATATYTGVKIECEDKNLAFVNSKGVLMTKTKEGTALVTATSLVDPTVKATFVLKVECQNPVTSIELGKDGVIEMEFKDIYMPEPVILPENADYKEVSYKIEDPTIASFYQANIVAHKVGETKLTVTAKDGKGASTVVRLVVKPLDSTPYDGYQDGTFILNEAWFGHENGDMNFLSKEGDVRYRVYGRENEGKAFGATSCGAIIYGGKFYVTSKQQADGGDSNPGGGRLVIFDAKTMKYIKGFDEIGGGDGRALVGVNPNKVYVGTTNGIFPLNVEKMELGSVIEGTVGQNLYAGQPGDMVKTGKYVFAIIQSKGTVVIDAEKDTVVTCLDDKNIQGIAQTPDGNVWLASSKCLRAIDPVSLEEVQKVDFPKELSIACSWGAWRPTPFCASRTKNVLFWNAPAGWDNAPEYYRYEIGKDDINTLKPIFTLKGMPAESADQSQVPYGSVRYDDRSDELVVMTTQGGYGANYEHNWIHLVNATTGEVNKTIKLKQYYWFQELPVFPDKYAPEIALENNSVEMTLEKDEPVVFDLKGKVTDKDNMAYNILLTLKDAGDKEVVNAVLENDTLTLTPVATGLTKVVLAAESNGVVTEKEINVEVKNPVGIDELENGQNISCRNKNLYISGFAGSSFQLYDAEGAMLAAFDCDSDEFVYPLNLADGVYFLRSSSEKMSIVRKIVVR